MILDNFKSLLQDPPPGMAFEISEAGIAAARIGAKAELEFQALKSGTLAISPLKENVIDPDEFTTAVRALANTQTRKRKDVALILPDFCTRMAVLDFDNFPSDAKEQTALVKFRLKRSVPSLCSIQPPGGLPASVPAACSTLPASSCRICWPAAPTCLPLGHDQGMPSPLALPFLYLPLPVHI